MQAPAPTTAHTRINARASIVETREFWGQLCPQFSDAAPLILASLVVEADSLQAFAVAHSSREYDEERRQPYTSYARGPLHTFLHRFSLSTRTQAQVLADTYTIFL